MNNHAQKGFKPLIIKVVAVAMSICYVFGPSHNELNKVLHIVMHQIEIPNSVLAHSGQNNSKHIPHDLKNKSDKTHNHKFLQLIDDILEASHSKNDQKNSEIANQKIDKHISSKKSFKLNQLLFSIQILEKLQYNTPKIQKGFLKRIIDPPQIA